LATPSNIAAVFTATNANNVPARLNNSLAGRAIDDSTDATTGLVSDTITVTDPAVIATGVAVNATEGFAFTGVTVATFTDPGGYETTGDYSATIDWGDSTTPTAGAIVVVNPTNVALSGIASQSTTILGADASRAIDDNTDPSYGDGSVTHTDNLPDSYWEVQLSSTYLLDHITLFNRDDGAGSRLSNFHVSVFNGATEVFHQEFFTGAGSVAEGGSLDIPVFGIAGDRVRVQLNGLNNDGNGFLSLAEVQVFGGTQLGVAGSHTYGEEGPYTITTGIVHEASNPVVVDAVSNGGFEAGSLSPWTTGGDLPGEVGSVSSHSGSSEFEVANSGEPKSGTLSQTLTTVPGLTYTINIYAAAIGLGGESFASFSVIFDGVSAGSPAIVSIGSGYALYTFTGTATGSSTVLEVDYTLGSESLVGLGLDDISVTTTVPGAITATSSATVADAPLTAGAITPPTATEGTEFTNKRLFHFTDANPDPDITDFTATVTWGDGTSSTLTSTPSDNGQIVACGDGFDVRGTHTYGDEGSYFMAVSVADVGGSTVSSAPGLVHLYKGENNANDSLGAFDGTNNGATYIPGEVGQAFVFDGSGQNVSLSPGTFGTSDFSLSFWMQTYSANEQTVLGNRVTDSGGNFVSIRMTPDGTLAVELDQDGAGTNYVAVNTIAVVNDGALHHVAVVRQGTLLSVYIDGSLDGSSNSAGVTDITNANPLIAGYESTDSLGEGLIPYAGLLDEIGIYNQALTAGEVSAAFSAGSAGLPGTLNVADAALTPVTLTVPTGLSERDSIPFTTVFSFTDDNLNATTADYTASVNTGDATLDSFNNPTQVRVVQTDPGAFDVQLAYTFAEELAAQTFSVSVLDDGGASTSLSSTIDVADPAVIVNTPPITKEGQSTGTVIVATFTDPGGPESTDDYSASINWGDGTDPTAGTIVVVNPTNVALSGTASQSSTYTGSGDPVASLAIDDNTDPSYDDGSVTATDNLPDSYWEVQLSSTYLLDHITLFNRGDGIGSRLSNFHVSVFNGANEVFHQDYFVGSGSVPHGGSLDIPVFGIAGDRVRVQLNGYNNDGNGYLSLAEVQVFGGTQLGVAGSHTYAEESAEDHANSQPYQISVSINHEGVLTPDTGLTRTAQITVDEVAPIASAASGTFSATTAVLSDVQTIATFTDPGTPSTPFESTDDFSVQVNWGDGGGFVTDASVAISDPDVNGVYTVTGSHLYAAALTGSIQVKVLHEGTTSNTASTDLLVEDHSVTHPTVTAVTPSVTTITDAQVGLSTFTYAVTFSAAMSTSNADAPSIVFSAGGTTLSLVSGAWSLGNTVYTATYDVADANTTVTGITVTVSNAKDAAGNAQTAYTGQPAGFTIDTQNPSVTLIAVSDTLITDSDAGTPFTVAVTYGESMDITAGNVPQIAFSPSVSATLTFASGGWNVAHTVYTASYTDVAGGPAANNVQITVTGGKDANENPQSPASAIQLNAFSIQGPATTQLWSAAPLPAGWSKQLAGDFNGDGKTDIAAYYTSNGKWLVCISTGTKFLAPVVWSTFVTKAGWVNQVVGDFNHDGKADIAQFSPGTGR
jgi:hypothetical protein